MSAEPKRTCPSCGNEFSGAMEFCPVCMFRNALSGGVESGESPSEDTVQPALEQTTHRFEHYELVTDNDGKPVELGRGAMGVTYKAFDVDLQFPVTLKVIGEKYVGTVLGLPSLLARKAEALHLADRNSEALELINEAEALAERFEQPYFCAELHRLRGVFLAAIGSDESQIEASFRAAIRIANEQKSVSLEKRAEGTYAEYRRQKASASGGREFRLPLW